MSSLSFLINKSKYIMFITLREYQYVIRKAIANNR